MLLRTTHCAPEHLAVAASRIGKPCETEVDHATTSRHQLIQ